MTITRNFIRKWLVSLVALIAPTEAAEILNNIHIDHAFRYNSAADEWEIVIHGNDDDGDGNSDPDLDPDEAVMIVNDKPYPSSGGRVARPASSVWDFVGVDAGEDFWALPLASSPFLYVGWRTEGAFADYFDDDPRLGFTASFVKISLEKVTYSGFGSGHFFAYKVSGFTPEPWIASSDGITDDDGYYFSSGHAHTNMGFSDLGVYRIDYKASAFLDNDGGDPLVGTNPVESQIQSFYYGVGTFAEWKATHYEPHELVDDDPLDSIPEVTHIDSDTDKDGASLILEYAFNLIPVQPDAQTLVPGTGTKGLPVGDLDESGADPQLAIEFVRRRPENTPRITYHPEFSSSLDGVWESSSASETVTTIDADWERVRIVDTPPEGEEGKRFGRVRVVLE